MTAELIETIRKIDAIIGFGEVGFISSVGAAILGLILFIIDHDALSKIPAWILIILAAFFAGMLVTAIMVRIWIADIVNKKEGVL